MPTIDEAGVPGLHISFWHGLWVPKGTPKDVIAKLNAAVVDALADPAVRQRLTDLGQEIVPREQQTPAALGAYHKAEIEKWWPIIKAANIKAAVMRSPGGTHDESTDRLRSALAAALARLRQAPRRAELSVAARSPGGAASRPAARPT